MIGVYLIDEDGPMLAAMSGKVALSVAIDIKPAHHLGATNGVLPHAGEDCPAFPGHILRHANIHR
jgi:hypothetical protein